MDLWLDISTLESEREINQEFQDQFDRLWTGSSSDVAVVQLDDFRGQEEAKSLIGMVEWILVRCSDWTMIPLENIIAAASGSGTKIAASISKEIELNGVAFALQHGVDAMVVPFEPRIISAAKKIAGEKPSKYAESTPLRSTSFICRRDINTIWWSWRTSLRRFDGKARFRRRHVDWISSQCNGHDTRRDHSIRVCPNPSI